MIILAEDAQKELIDLGFQCWVVTDRELFAPHAGWLPEFWGRIRGRKKPAIENARDCDDFAFWARVEASDENAASGRKLGHTFLICTIGLYANFNGIDAEAVSGHATNIVRTSDQGWVFFEPQPGETSDARRALDSGLVTPRCVWV